MPGKHARRTKLGVPALWLGAGIFLLLLVAGVVRSLATRHSIPSIDINYAGEMRELIQHGSPALALPSLRLAMKIDFDNEQACVELLRLAREAGDLDSAVAALEALTRFHPEDPAIRHELVSGLLSQGRAHEAFEHGKVLLRLAPQSASVYCGCGAALLLLGRNYDAANYYRKAIELDPNSEAARLALEYPLRGF